MSETNGTRTGGSASKRAPKTDTARTQTRHRAARERRLRPVESPEEQARVRAAYEAEAAEYLHRLGLWARRSREDAGESQETVQKMMRRDGLHWSHRVVRDIEELALFTPDARGGDAPLPKVNHLVLRWLARHYGTPLDRLERYLSGGEYPTLGRSEQQTALVLSQLSPDQLDTTLSFARWLLANDVRFAPVAGHPVAQVANVANVGVMPGASSGHLQGPPPPLRKRIAVEEMRAEMDAAAQMEREPEDDSSTQRRSRDGGV